MSDGVSKALARAVAVGLVAVACSSPAPTAGDPPTESLTGALVATPSPSPSPSLSPTPAPSPSPTPAPSPTLEPVPSPITPPERTHSPTPTPEPSPTRPRPTERIIVEQDWVVFANAAGVKLHYPSRRVELIGFHESTHEGAQNMLLSNKIQAWVEMETRERGSPSRSAADIVVDPATEIRSPVTGTVKRSGSYTLYCDHTDHFLVITPDGHPDFEVKILHFEGLTVTKGDRVEGGVTVVGSRGRSLPFESQVDEYTAEPSWPHVHVELVDTNIPNIPGDGPAC